MSAEKTKPVAKINVGSVNIAIWKGESEKGAYYTAGIPQIRYRDANGEWQNGKSLGDRDLINLIKAAALAHSEILKLKHKDRAQDTGDQPGDGYDE